MKEWMKWEEIGQGDKIPGDERIEAKRMETDERIIIEDQEDVEENDRGDEAISEIYKIKARNLRVLKILPLLYV